MFLSLRSTLSETATLWPFAVSLVCFLVGGWLALSLLVPGRRRARGIGPDAAERPR